MQRFGEKLHTLRVRHHLSLRDLAHELGYTAHAHLGFVESGQRKPSLDLVMRVAQRFGLTPDRLLRDDLELFDDPPPNQHSGQEPAS
jgi:transcriptional regulator with XRE-family HTH domain